MQKSILNNFETIIVLAPHTDDGELGCGGTINKLILLGKKVIYVAFSICEESVPNNFPSKILGEEVKEATSVLGIAPSNLIVKNYKVRKFLDNRQDLLEDMVELNRQYNPDLIFCPAITDIHQDHQAIHNEAKRAFKQTSIFGYEFVWNSYSSKNDIFIQLNEENIKAKVNALKKYKSQGIRIYTNEESVKVIASFRGLQVKKKYVESFELIRLIIE